MTPSGVRQMITRRGLQAGVDAVVGKAGTGKSTALGAYRAVLDATGIPVIGVAPSATAAHQLAVSAGITDTGTVDRLLTELRHRRRTLPHGVVMIVDEAAMCPTRSRLALQRAVDAVDGKVVDVGDHRQIPSVDVGGDHYALAQRLGATERATVGEVNHVARDHLIARGDIARRSRTYRSPDHNHTITLAVGDEVILRRNQRLAQPDGTTVAVRNGMTGRVTAARRGHATIQLDAAHRTPGEPPSVTLPAAYVGTHVEYSYARTVDTAQGATVDHSLFTPSNSASAERAYVALSRGRLTNRIYATRDQTWIDALGRDRSHALAVDQSPDIHPTIHRALRRRPATRDQERHPPLELDL